MIPKKNPVKTPYRFSDQVEEKVVRHDVAAERVVVHVDSAPRAIERHVAGDGSVPAERLEEESSLLGKHPDLAGQIPADLRVYRVCRKKEKTIAGNVCARCEPRPRCHA